MRRLVGLALGVWVARWLAQELAAYAGRHWIPPNPAAKDPERRPGWMPHPNG